MIDKRFSLLYQVGSEVNPRVTYPNTLDGIKALKERMIAAKVFEQCIVLEFTECAKGADSTAFILRKLDTNGNPTYVSRMCVNAPDLSEGADAVRKTLNKGETVRAVKVGVKVLEA